MIAGFALLAGLSGPTPPVPAAASWPSLPLLVRRHPAPIRPDVFVFVRDKVDAGRCGAATVDADGTSTVRVPAVVLVDPRGRTGPIVAAIGCPAVERYTADLVERTAAGNVRAPWPAAAACYRTALTYSWTRPVLRSR